jgi:predicted GIY-YIG superfamily endonuclease
MIGIYKIENLVNHKCYIGQAVDINRRWRKHRETYNEPKFPQYEYPLYRAMRK